MKRTKSIGASPWLYVLLYCLILGLPKKTKAHNFPYSYPTYWTILTHFLDPSEAKTISINGQHMAPFTMDTYSGTLKIDLTENKAPLFVDSDGDGLDDELDLDDDNDGVPDTMEVSDNCGYVGGEDLTTVSFNGNADLDVNATTNSISVNKASVTAWASTYSDQTFNLPIYLEFTVMAETGNAMIGMIPENGAQTPDSWNDAGYKIHFQTASAFYVWYNGIQMIASNYADGDLFSITIDGSGNATVSQNGTLIHTQTVPVLPYRMALSSTNTAVRTYQDVVVGTQSGLQYQCEDLDADNDGIPNRLDLDSDGDGCSDAYEAGATTNSTPDYQFPGSNVGSNGLDNDLETSADSGEINYQSSYGYAALDSAKSPCSTEICGDGIDNDADYYVDGFDSDCVSIPDCVVTAQDNSNFSIVKSYSTPKINANSVTPVVGDIDGDGMPEIIVASASPNAAGYRIYEGDGSDFNDNTLDIQLPLQTSVSFPVASPAIADIDKDGTAEIIALGMDQHLYVFDHTGGTSGSYMIKTTETVGYNTGSPRVHDINEDGIPEVIVGNAVYSFNASYTSLNRVVQGTISEPDGSVINHAQEWDKDIVVIDILPDYPGKEIVAGGTIYSIDFINGTRTAVKRLNDIDASWPVNEDGAVAVADMDLDGDLDVVITSNFNTFSVIWDPVEDQVIKKINTGTGYHGMPMIADVYDDITEGGQSINLPETIFIAGATVYCINAQFASPIWTLATSDGSSTTSISSYDFNGDGIVELVYRDQSQLRVFNGNSATPTVLASFTAGSGTWAEGPVIADVDNDGHAEIVLVSDVTAAATAIGLGHLDVFDSGEDGSWVDAPNYWNQRGYRYSNINPDLTVPTKEQSPQRAIPEGSGVYPLNVYNTQVNDGSLFTNPGEIAAPDITTANVSFIDDGNGNYNCPDLTLNLQLQNQGDATMPSGFYISLFDGDPSQAGTNHIRTLRFPESIEPGTTESVDFQLVIPPDLYPFSTLYYVINTKKTVTIPLTGDDYNVNPEECDYTNNIFQVAMPPCEDTDSDGIADFVDIDDDNDGVLDTTETSSNCQYLGGYDINKLSFTGNADVDVKTTTNGITTQKISTTAWASVYSDQSFDLPLHLEFTASTETVHAMIGLIPETGVETVDNWNDAGYKIQFTNSGSDFIIRYNGSAPLFSGTYSDGDTFAVDIDAAGNISSTQNGLPIHSQTVPIEAYQMVLSNYTPTVRTYDNILFDTLDKIYYVCDDLDIDNDGTPNRLDLDSDGDSCSDAYESGATSDGSANYQFPNTAVGVNGLHDGVETSPDSGEINYGSTYSLFALNNDPDTCSDNDGDGIGNLTDLDDDNDGVLDTLEASYHCTYLGSENLSAFTFNNDPAINADFAVNNLTLNRTDGTTWASTYSHQTVSAPLYFEFTVDAINSRSMIGLIEESAVQTLGNWNDQSHKFFFLNNVDYNIRDFGSGAINADTYAAGDVFSIEIDASGNLSMKRNGVVVYSDSVTGINFRLVFSAVDSTPKTFSDMVYGNTDEMVSSCEDRDTDGDGIVDRFDLDSDNDGCADANEAYSSTTADSNGDGTYGGEVGPADVHPDGTVITASYPGTNTNVTTATSLNISQAAVDHTVSLYANTTFSVTASAISTTTYTGAPPATLPNYTIPPATEVSTDPQYQWQVDDGTGFVNISDGGIYSGATTNILSLSRVKTTEDGNQYRVLVTHPDNVCVLEESTATLTVEMPVPFECNSSAYLVSSPAGTTPSTVYIVEATNPNNIIATITPSIADRYNAIGYNFEDNLIYGMSQGDSPSFTSGDLFLMDSNGKITPLGVPIGVVGQSTGLPVWTANASVNANSGRVGLAPGVIGNNGMFYSFVHTANPAAYLVIVDLETMEYTTQRLSLDMPSQSDLAFSPYNGMLYGIQGGQIIETNPTNGQQTIITVAGGSATLPGASGGAWNDIQGRVYFYDNVTSTTNRLYRYDPATNVVTDLVGVDPYPTFDATACFPTRLEKQVNIPSEGLVPGDVVEFEFSIYNAQVLPMTYDFEDILASSDLSWVAGSINPSTIGGGTVIISGQTLNINGITVQPSAATGGPLTFRVSVKIADDAAYGGCYNNQAAITTGGTTVVSDNPETEEYNDPTLFCLNLCGLEAPLSGGNIQECANNPIQKLTATATVPSGVQLIWYDAPVNGNVVADPSLETVGTITYYAAADDGTCIGENRTPVTLNIRPAPMLDAIEDGMSCVSYVLPEITGTDLTGNEAYYTEPNGLGTKYLPGDVFNNIGATTLYVYDEMAAVDNCEGITTVTSNTGYAINDLFGDGTHHQYPGTIDPAFWSGSADQQILYNAPGSPTGPQIYLGLVGDVSLGNTDACFGDMLDVQAQVTVTNQGPGNGAGYSGRFAIINTGTDQILYEIALTSNFPANSTITPIVSGVVPVADVLAGNIAVMIAVETFQSTSKNWLLSDFSAGYRFLPESLQACSDQQSFELTINELPGLVITDPDPACLPGTVDLTDAAVTTGSTPGLVFSYFTDPEGTMALANPETVSVTGTYYIQGEDPVTGCSTIMPVEAVLIDAPEVIVGQPFCINGQGSIEVTDPLGVNFEYSINGTDYQADPVFGSVAPGTYSVTARNLVTNCVSLGTEAIINENPEVPTPIVMQPNCDLATGTISIPEYTDATYSIDGGTTFETENVFDNLPAGDYTVIIRDGFACDSDPVDITIDAAPEVPAAPISGGDQTVCADNPVQTLTATATVDTGETLVWYDAPTAGNVVANPILDAIGTITYYAEATNITCPSAARTPVVLTIEPAPHIDPLIDQMACGEFVLPAITGSGLSGNGAYYTQQNGVGTRYEVGDIIATIGVTTLYIYDVVGGCSDEQTFTLNIQDQVTAGAIGQDQTICNGEAPLELTSETAGTGSGILSYRWEQSTTDAFNGFSVIAGAVAASYTPTALTQTTYYRRTTISDQFGMDCESAPTTAVTITVQDATTAGTIGSDQTICNGETPLPIISTANGSGSGTLTYRWEGSADGIAFAPIVGETGANYVPGAMAQTTHYRRVTISEENGVSCESVPTATVTITVQDATTAGTIGSDQTICNGEIPLSIGSTVDGSGSGTITYRWEESADGVAFAPIAGATLADYNPGALAQTTYYRRVTISGENGISCESTPTATVAITVQDTLSAGSIGPDQTICNGENPLAIISTVNGTGSGILTYQWEESADGVAFAPIAGVTSADYNPGALAGTTYFRRVAISEENGVSCESAPTNIVIITVQDMVTEGAIGPDRTICNGEAPLPILSTANGTGSGNITYRWEESIDGIAFAPIAGATSANYGPGTLAQTTYYRRITFSQENGVSCESAPTATVTITVQDVTSAGSIGSDQTICNGEIPSPLTSTLNGTGSGTITYRWEESADGVTFAPIAGETAAGYVPGALAHTTYFRRVTISEENGVFCEAALTATVTITVQDVTSTGSIGSDQTICNGEIPSPLTSILNGTGSGTITYRWEESADGVAFAPIAGETAASYGPGALAQTTYFRRVAISEENGISCEAAPTATVTITVQDVTSAGSIGSDQTICNGEVPSPLTSTLDGAGSGTLTYRWEESADGVAFAPIAGETAAGYGPGALAQTTYFRRVAISEENGVFCEVAPTAAVTITVQGVTSAGSIGSDQTICNGETPSPLTSTLDGTGSGTLTYRWEESTDGVAFAPIAGETGASYSSGTLAQTTYFRRVTISGENGVPCESEPTATVTITVQDVAAAGSIGSDQTICNGEVPSTLASTLDGSGSGTITYRWEESTDGVAFAPIVGETGASYGPGALAQTTYYRRVAISEENGVSCESEPTATVTITVQDVTSAGSIGSDQTICNGETPSPLTSTLDGTGSGTLTYRWEESADGVAFAPIAGETAANYSSGTLAQTTYFRRVTISGENGVPCESEPTATVTITVQDVAAAGSIGSDQTICNGEVPSTLASTLDGSGSGTITYRWEESTDGVAFAPIVGETGASYDPGALAQTTYYRRVAISEENGVSCESEPTATVTITMTSTPEGYDDMFTGVDCSGSFSYNLQDNVDDTSNGGNGIPADFIWEPLPNPEVSGASAGSGPIIDQGLINLSTTVQTVVYRITARSLTNGNCSSEFELSVSVPVCSSLNLEKVSDVSSVDQAGDLINYTISLTNTGNASHSGVIMDDPLLGGTLSILTGDNGNNILEAGESWTYSGSYIVSQADLENNGNPITGSGFIHNVATLGTDQLISSQTADNDVAIAVSPGIVLLKTAEYKGDSAQAQQGDIVTYTFTVANTGNVGIHNLTVNDPLLGGNIGSATNGDTNGNGILELTETWVYEVDYAITQADVDRGSVENQAIASGYGSNGDPVNDVSGTSETNDDPTSIPLPPYAIISLVKTASFNDLNGDGHAQPGESITYAFTVENVGERTLTNINLTDPKVSVEGGPIVRLAPGESDNWTFTAEYTITQTDIDLGTVSNTATVSGMDPGGHLVTDQSGTDPNNDEPTRTTLPLKESMELVKTAVFNDENSDGHAQEGETITYTFTVTNTGNLALIGVKVEDPLLNPSTIDITPSELLPGAAATTTATYTITKGDWEEGKVTNTAKVSGQAPDGTEVSDVSGTAGDNDDPTITPLQVTIENIFIPNVITPNGDGDNDVFEITGMLSNAQIRLVISNRWGNEVYKNSSYKNDFNGEGLNEGTYFYQISISNPSGSEQSYQGWLFIKR